MKKLLKSQVEERNEKINALYQKHQAIKIEIDDKNHYLSSVSETGFVYLDGSTWEGELDDMSFLDYSPDDGCDFEDLSQEQYDQVLKDLYSDTSIVDIILVIEKSDCEKDEIEYEDTVYNLEDSYLQGYICQKESINSEEDPYIALAEFDEASDKYKIFEYHPIVLKQLEERKKDVENLDNLLQEQPHQCTILGPNMIEIKLLEAMNPEYLSTKGIERLLQHLYPKQIDEIDDDLLLITLSEF